MVTRRVKYDLERALRDLHINEGYRIAADHTEEIIRIVRASDSIADAKNRLMEIFSLSDLQAQAIVDMTIGRLSGLERQKVIDRIEKLTELIRGYREILADEGRLKQLIKDEMMEIRRRYADERRTELVPVENEIVLEDLIERHICVITMTRSGYIKRQPSDTFAAQRRGGKGIIGMTMKEEDVVEHVVAVDSHEWMMLFTTRGRVHVRKAYVFPEAGRTAKGSNIVNILDLEEGEKITAMVPVASFQSGEYLTMVTRRGIVKRTELAEYAIQRRGGKIALTLDENDELLYVRRTKGDDKLLIATRDGWAVCFDERDVRAVGRMARGVTGIRLEAGDEVAGAAVVLPDSKLLTVTERGYGKRSEFADYPIHHRGGKGVHCSDICRTGRIAAIAPVREDDDIMLMTSEGTMVRTPVSGIPVYSRTAGGVIVMRLEAGAKVANLARVTPSAEEMEAAEEASKKEPDSAAAAAEEPETEAEERGMFDDGDDSLQ